MQIADFLGITLYLRASLDPKCQVDCLKTPMICLNVDRAFKFLKFCQNRSPAGNRVLPASFNYDNLILSADPALFSI